MTMKASSGSILEYQIDQPSIQPPGPLTDPLHSENTVQAVEIAPDTDRLLSYSQRFPPLAPSYYGPSGRRSTDGEKKNELAAT
jgi:hypothetical protein